MSCDHNSWKTLPLPEKREILQFTAVYSKARAAAILAGFRPKDMDDKWFIVSELGWVYFHRSWTGACIFAFRLDASPAGARVTDAWVSRDKSQYRYASLEEDRKILTNIIDRHFPSHD